MNYYMGIDIGTSSVKTLIMEEGGLVIGTAQKGYEIVKKRVEYAEQNVENLWKATKETIQTVLKEHAGIASQIKAISYSGQMHGLVTLDKSGNPIRDAIIWADQRSQESIQKIYQTIKKEEYQSITLNTISTGFLISSLMWVKEHETKIYEAIDKVMLPKDYIRYRMCQELGTDMSDASSTLIFDTAKRDWAWEFIDALGIKKEMFVPCHESYGIAGKVTASCAEETGLLKGTTVVYGGGDSLMQAVGNGMIGQDALSSNIGTASQVACTITKPLHDKQYRTNTFCHVREDLWMITGANVSGGVALKWLMDQVLYMNSFDEMTALAETVPSGSEGLLFLPYLCGERTPYNDPNAKGIYHGFTLTHNRAHMIRSTMEGIIFALRNSQEIMEEMGIPFSKIIASGGGARGQLFRQIQADVFQKEVYTSLVHEQACVGAAITAAVGVGVYASYEEACGRITKLSDHITEPAKEHQSVYEERYKIFKELYPCNQSLFQELKK